MVVSSEAQAKEALRKLIEQQSVDTIAKWIRDTGAGVLNAVDAERVARRMRERFGASS